MFWRWVQVSDGSLRGTRQDPSSRALASLGWVRPPCSRRARRLCSQARPDSVLPETPRGEAHSVLAGAGSARAELAVLWSWAACSSPDLEPLGSHGCPPWGCICTRAAERVPRERRVTSRPGSTQISSGDGSTQRRAVRGHSRDGVCSSNSGAEGPKGKRTLRKLMQNKGWSWVELPQAFLPPGQMAALALCRSPGTSQPEPRCHMVAFA